MFKTIWLITDTVILKSLFLLCILPFVKKKELNSFKASQPAVTLTSQSNKLQKTLH